MRVAIVGAGGFVGTALCRHLAAQGHEVVAIGRGDAEPTRPVAVVVHLALFNEDDARGARERWRDRAGRLVAISSGDVYRPYGQLHGSEPWDGQPVRPLDEGAPLRARLYPYGREVVVRGRTLVDYEKILVERALPGAVILRLPKVYGPGDRQRTFGRELAELASGELRIDEAAARWRWTHGYVDDVAAAIALAAVHPAAAGRTYNIGERETPTMGERYAALAALVGGRVVAVPGGTPRPDLVLDTRRIREELGYAEESPPGEALARTVTALAESSA
jgi:nucleoside-diphosphate-sugar epimerase